MPIVDFSLEGKVALITGGSKGIGRATALAYAENGADVAIASRGKEELEATAKEIEAHGRRVIAVPTNIGNEDELRALYEQTVSELGGVDILINNAAYAKAQPMEEITPKDFERGMRINVASALLLSQLCRQSMLQRGGGVIVHVSSDDCLRPSTGIGIYSTAKAALVHLAKHMAAEWGPDGIRVLAVSPGLVRTYMARGICKYVEAQGDKAKLNPLKNKVGEPEEIAGALLLAASPAGAYLNGGNIVLDGGTQALSPVQIDW